MNSPRLIINLSKLIHNYSVIKKHCDQKKVTLTTVLKGVAGDPRIIEGLIENGVSNIGDSRLENLAALTGYPQLTKLMLRLPAVSNLNEVLRLSDVSLNSELITLERLNQLAATIAPKRHQVILMVDLGDLREGVSAEDSIRLGKACRQLKNIEVIGVGTNFSCFAGVRPSLPKLNTLIEIAQCLKDEFKLPVQLISGGNSSSLPLLYNGELPDGINHLRIGEGILLGRETLTGSNLPDLFQDVFILEAEVLQVQWKINQPTEAVGYNAFGRVPTIPDCEPGYRLLINVGQQDTSITGLQPLEKGLTILGGSSDYLVLASETKLKVGTMLRFLPDYWSLLSLMTSRYITKHYLV
ncbi:MAG TPA: alanine racemase [Bacillota bacterium]|nr:alanine racemase [Bacillota bacterium]HPO98070.1 alanine racemase [Bacillota bacterium]